VGKRIVHGLLQRGGEMRANVIDAADASAIHAIIHKNVEPGAAVFSDESTAYAGLDRQFVHEAVNHAEQYVRGQVHTNGVENFWSLFKRCLKGTYVHMAPLRLQLYVTEEVFRFNARKTNDKGRFDQVMGQTVGRRLTHRQLCETDGCGFVGLE
jgi:transposase-like protein